MPVMESFSVSGFRHFFTECVNIHRCKEIDDPLTLAAGDRFALPPRLQWSARAAAPLGSQVPSPRCTDAGIEARSFPCSLRIPPASKRESCGYNRAGTSLKGADFGAGTPSQDQNLMFKQAKIFRSGGGEGQGSYMIYTYSQISLPHKPVRSASAIPPPRVSTGARVTWRWR